MWSWLWSLHGNVFHNHLVVPLFAWEIPLFQENESMPSKWSKFCLHGSFWCHLPVLQPFVHLTYLKELSSLDIKIQENLKHYIISRSTVISGRKLLSEKQNDTYSFGQKYFKYKSEKNQLLATFLQLKLLEAFLEAGPQFAFQISVILQDGLSGTTQIVTIVTSAISLTWTSSELFLKYPTEVSIKPEYLRSLDVCHFHLHVIVTQIRPLSRYSCLYLGSCIQEFSKSL